MSKYHFKEIEAKWQEQWAKKQTFKANNTSEKPKYYVLDMFPYPSGAGLHVGHPLGYIASDVYARFKRHQGFNVLHPMGYDSFGLPAEQYAIQTGQHPAQTTKVNIEGGVDNGGNKIHGYRNQLDKIGFSFDWSREVRTSNPDYYKWTQWIFLQLFDSWYCKDVDKALPISELIKTFEAKGNKTVNAECDDDVEVFSAQEWNDFSEVQKQEILLKYRLTFLAETEVNWCPQLGTVLANDEIVNGVSERGGFPVVRKKMKQWSMRITAYAQRLLDGLDTVDWPQPLKDSQTNWIGRSKGASVSFNVKNVKPNADETVHTIDVFTTRPDTIYGVSFMVLAPEHDLVSKITTAEQKKAVDAYVQATAKRSERERMADVKSITGVFTGAYAEHPFTGEAIPIWIGDYVLASYGTGAVMSVPCGDQRDYDFAKQFNLPIPNIFKDADISEEAFSDKENTTITNSDFLNDLTCAEATEKIIEALEERGIGSGKINYRLRDAVFSRQRYWGEPFPIYYKDAMPHAVPTKCLPLRLPEVEKYLPTEEGEPPLGRADNWAWDTEKLAVVSNDLIDNKTVFPLELNTMPGWAGSSWYFFRYMESEKRDEVFASTEALNYWQNVDLYIGGSEHATGHLLYSRFWVKFMHDRNFVPVDEPFKKLINQGMILGESAFVHRIEGENKFVTASLAKTYNTQLIHADVAFVNIQNELDVEAFKNWREEYKTAEFITEEDGTFKVTREVEKMSKSKYNVVSPDDICEQYGADTLRMYEMFLGPLEQAKPWNTAGITGVHGFLKKLWKLYHSGEDSGFNITDDTASKESLKTLHKTIKKVQEDIENFSFNTSVSSFMIAVNEFTAQKCNSREVLEPFIVLISPYAPHIAEELWQKLGHSKSISMASFPKFEEKFLVESTKKYPISFNGKMRFTLELALDLSKDEIETAVMAHEKTIQYLGGRTPKKIIVVPGKIVNIVG
ncbi:MAG: leucine--tRNA ligase [Aequorivita sp.]|nr:leucine--tRNA ligase [Aequorivita sp.]|tara:strand:+ start:127639 stop:130521 length:2883 start_codon:yes stop_codon:yes gene_type:complete